MVWLTLNHDAMLPRINEYFKNHRKVLATLRKEHMIWRYRQNSVECDTRFRSAMH